VLPQVPQVPQVPRVPRVFKGGNKSRQLLCGKQTGGFLKGVLTASRSASAKPEMMKALGQASKGSSVVGNVRTGIIGKRQDAKALQILGITQ
jgi:hypothetical protein